jgi:7-cyano-7-deazaguanine synthase in queuosine biosynthesis
MLEYLTGDIWHLSFVINTTPLFGLAFRTARRDFRKRTRIKGTAVSLFSGGLDSLTGVVDWLEENPGESLILASSYDAHAENAKNDQRRLLPKLSALYPGRVTQFVARSGLVSKGNDTNFRSRSLTFLGNAVLAASFLGKDTRIAIPENGAIALNYPLSAARSGSFSTRTVHPFFIDQFKILLSQLGFDYSVENRYQFKTKGEVLQESQNQSALLSLYADSVSCGKRGRKMYWDNRQASACGYCVPCVFRQAAVHKAGFRPEGYGCTIAEKNKWGRLDLLKPNSDLQTVTDFVNADLNKEIIWRKLRSNGPLQSLHKAEYVGLIIRLRAELKTWLASVNLG